MSSYSGNEIIVDLGNTDIFNKNILKFVATSQKYCCYNRHYHYSRLMTEGELEIFEIRRLINILMLDWYRYTIANL